MKIHASSFVKLPVDPVDLNLFQSVCKRAIKATDSYNVFQKVIVTVTSYISVITYVHYIYDILIFSVCLYLNILCIVLGTKIF